MGHKSSPLDLHTQSITWIVPICSNTRVTHMRRQNGACFTARIDNDHGAEQICLAMCEKAAHERGQCTF